MKARGASRRALVSQDRRRSTWGIDFRLLRIAGEGSAPALWLSHDWGRVGPQLGQAILIRLKQLPFPVPQTNGLGATCDRIPTFYSTLRENSN